MQFLRHLQYEYGMERAIAEGILVALARLDDHFATVVTCFTDDITAEAGGIRKSSRAACLRWYF